MSGTTVITVLLVKMLLVASCFIPSSGMENTLYQGEGVLVNKWSYGLRLPFPSLFGYHRIGSGRVEKGDIILFNNPTPVSESVGIEHRDLFISRCVALPGDTLMLNGELIDTGGEVLSPDSKSLYVYPAGQEDFMLSVLDVLGIAGNVLVGYTKDGGYLRSFSHYEAYLVSQKAGSCLKMTPLNSRISQKVHPFIVPKRGQAVKVYPWNAILLCNTISHHEGKEACLRGDTLLVGGTPVTEYVFSKDYYWVASNNPVNLCDSRLFGFVPEDHLIGKAWIIWFPSRKERFFQRVE